MSLSFAESGGAGGRLSGSLKTPFAPKAAIIRSTRRFGHGKRL
nr:hypothetical protein [uncultured Kingella sp.]